MEVKLSISSSRRISFASDFKDIDLEVEQLENERNNPTHYRGRVSYINSDSDDDVESNYVTLSHFSQKLSLTLNAIANFCLSPKARNFLKNQIIAHVLLQKQTNSDRCSSYVFMNRNRNQTCCFLNTKKCFFASQKANRFRLSQIDTNVISPRTLVKARFLCFSRSKRETVNPQSLPADHENYKTHTSLREKITRMT